MMELHWHGITVVVPDDATVHTSEPHEGRDIFRLHAVGPYLHENGRPEYFLAVTCDRSARATSLEQWDREVISTQPSPPESDFDVLGGVRVVKRSPAPGHPEAEPVWLAYVSGRAYIVRVSDSGSNAGSAQAQGILQSFRFEP